MNIEDMKAIKEFSSFHIWKDIHEIFPTPNASQPGYYSDKNAIIETCGHFAKWHSVPYVIFS